MSEEKYSPELFRRDLAALGGILAAHRGNTVAAILEHCHRVYFDPLEADFRAHVLTRTYQFLSDHRGALLDAGFSYVDAHGVNRVQTVVMQALYTFLVTTPHSGFPPEPDLEYILAMARMLRDA